jgi:hypothetical protein
VSDSHCAVVDDASEMVCRQSIRLHQHLVVNRRVLERNCAADAVLHDSGAAVTRHAQTHDVRRARGHAHARIGVVNISAMTIVLHKN